MTGVPQATLPGAGPLPGVRVPELGQIIAGTYGGQVLSDCRALRKRLRIQRRVWTSILQRS